jgi:hypothetical protein
MIVKTITCTLTCEIILLIILIRVFLVILDKMPQKYGLENDNILKRQYAEKSNETICISNEPTWL